MASARAASAARHASSAARLSTSSCCTVACSTASRAPERKAFKLRAERRILSLQPRTLRLHQQSPQILSWASDEEEPAEAAPHAAPHLRAPSPAAGSFFVQVVFAPHLARAPAERRKVAAAGVAAWAMPPPFFCCSLLAFGRPSLEPLGCGWPRLPFRGPFSLGPELPRLVALS